MARAKGGTSLMPLRWKRPSTREHVPAHSRARCEAAGDKDHSPTETWTTDTEEPLLPRVGRFHPGTFAGEVISTKPDFTLPENSCWLFPCLRIFLYLLLKFISCLPLQAQYRHTSSEKSLLILPQKPHHPTPFHVVLPQNLVT